MKEKSMLIIRNQFKRKRYNVFVKIARLSHDEEIKNHTNKEEPMTVKAGSFVVQ